MKKLILFLILFFNFITATYAAWYWNHSIFHSNPWSAYLVAWSVWWSSTWPNRWTRCNDDNDWSPWTAVTNNSTSLTPINNVTEWVPSWEIRCLYRDGERPQVVHDYINDWIWSNANSATINFIQSDSWGSHNKYVKYCEWAWCTPSIVATQIIKWANYNKKIRYQAFDNAWNPSDVKQLDLKLDNVAPTWTLSYFAWWTNNVTQVIRFTASDNTHPFVNSWVKNYTLQVSTSTDNPNFTSWSWWINVSLCTNMTTGTSCNVTLANNKAYKYQLVIEDKAWNIKIVTSSNVIKVDTTPPTLTDVTNSMTTNVLATNSRAYSLSVWDNWGSPVNIIEWNSENKDNQMIFDSRNITTRNLNLTTLSFPWDISKVDNYRTPNWWREYTFRLTRICDAAWNCPTFNEPYNHNVYANTNNIPIKSVTYNQLDDDNIADGTTKNLVITLKDTYWNAIVPASWINRKVNIKYEYDNTMYLNQFLKTWNSVYNSKSNILNPSDINQYLNYFWIWTLKIKEFDNEYSTDWTYKYWFKFYTPTASSIQRKKSDTNAKFDIHNINFNVTGDIWAIWDTLVDNSTNIKAKFKPLYQTEITWEIDENWFIAWNPQKSTLKINNDWWRINDTSLNNIYFKFWWNSTTLQKYNLNIKWGNFSSYTQIPESWYSTSFWFSNNSDFLTILDLEHAPAPATISANLTTHIAYKIDWKDVVYNSDKVWQDTDWIDVVTQQANQVWLKVIWTTYSKADIQDVVEGQNIQSIWKFDKSSTKLSIIKNAYAFAKNVNPSSYDYINSIDNPGSWYTQIGDIIYFWNDSGKLYRLWDGSNINVSTKKTILVIGWNLYIKSNINYSWNWMLWIVVLKDNAWNWWNVYIDPWVKNISANIFAEKSLISYNWTTELDWSTPASTLNNQLRIYWSVFSYNTIWWSAKTPLECPYYVPASNCDTKSKAQKYDLNYLRRYYLKTNSFWNLEPAYGWLSNYNSWDTNYKYPVIIEYNPNIQKNPPPLFSD